MALLVAALAGGAFASPAAAQAPPGCAAAPDAIVAPDPPSDTDRIVRELRDSRIETAQSCAALSARLDALGEHATALGSDGGAIRDAVDALAAVEPGAVTLADSDLELFTDTLSAVRADVWFVIGTLCALFFAGFLIRRDA